MVKRSRIIQILNLARTSSKWQFGSVQSSKWCEYHCITTAQNQVSNNTKTINYRFKVKHVLIVQQLPSIRRIWWTYTEIGRFQNCAFDMNLTETHSVPDSKVHGANMGSIWGRQDPGGPHVDPMKVAIRGEAPLIIYVILLSYPWL